MSDLDDNLKKTIIPGKLAMKYHPLYKGKIEIVPKCPITKLEDFSIWYTPGVAEPCKQISNNVNSVFDYTNRGNTIAVVSDCTRVLGLGDIGPEAGLPVMEGKSLLFKFLGGVDAVPLVLRTKVPDELISTVKILEPSFGGINLEDIEKPKCFYILEKLKKELNIPVWHDDAQGTATVQVTALLNALKYTGRNIKQAKITLLGAGASSISIAQLLITTGANPKNIILVDSKGILNQDRLDLKDIDPYKWDLCLITNGENRIGDISDALVDSDVCLATSKSGPDIIKKEWIRKMSENGIVFACANPILKYGHGTLKKQEQK